MAVCNPCYRERKASRFQGFADNAAKRSDARFKTASGIADNIPFGQPILVGHHSERGHRRDQSRIESNMFKGLDEQKRAERWQDRADATANNTAISSYDPEALEKLEGKIAGIEAERDRIKAYNASCRKGKADGDLLNESQRAHLLGIATHASYQLGKNGSFPSYALSNLNGNLKRYKDRLQALTKIA